MAVEKYGAARCGSVTLYNTTPHDVCVVDFNGNVVLTVPKAAEPLRLREVTNDFPLTLAVGGAAVPVVEKAFAGVEDLPPAAEGTFYIVSLAVAQAARRDDFLVPDDLVRDDQGRIVGCRRFAVWCEPLY